MFTMFTKRCPKPCLPGEGRISPCWTLELFFEAWLLNSASLKILQNLQEKGGTNCLIRWVYRKIYRKATYLMGKSMVSRFDFPLDQSNDCRNLVGSSSSPSLKWLALRITGACRSKSYQMDMQPWYPLSFSNFGINTLKSGTPGIWEVSLLNSLCGWLTYIYSTR